MDPYPVVCVGLKIQSRMVYSLKSFLLPLQISRIFLASLLQKLERRIACLALVFWPLQQLITEYLCSCLCRPKNYTIYNQCSGALFSSFKILGSFFVPSKQDQDRGCLFPSLQPLQNSVASSKCIEANECSLSLVLVSKWIPRHLMFWGSFLLFQNTQLAFFFSSKQRSGMKCFCLSLCSLQNSATETHVPCPRCWSYNRTRDTLCSGPLYFSLGIYPTLFPCPQKLWI